MDLHIINFISISLLLGFLPPLLWLLFWLREDKHPEPKKEILIVFLAGAAMVVLAVLFEKTVCSINNSFYAGQAANCHPVDFLLLRVPLYGTFAFQLLNIIGFALVEELSKAGAAYFTALRSRFFDEPVDAMVYMVTAALGFAALENVLFISQSLKAGVDQSIIVSAFRFINASLLHVSTSSMVGAGLAFSFFHREKRHKELFWGIFAATLLHVAYNFFIINSTWNAKTQIGITLIVIFGGAASLILFERARREII